MTVQYRRAAEGDWPLIDRLFRTAFCETFAHLYSAEDLTAFLSEFTEEAWTSELTNPRYAFLIAEDEGQPAGYIKLGPPALPVTPSGPPLELRQLYILKAWHGSGIAQKLMEWALDTARGRQAEELYLTVYTDNHRARRFYERYGFEYVGPYKFMVGNQADEDEIWKLDL